MFKIIIHSVQKKHSNFKYSNFKRKNPEEKKITTLFGARNELSTIERRGNKEKKEKEKK